MLADWMYDENGPYGLHKSMYLITLNNQATKEQKKAFLLPALEYKHIGCYAQTELGHGSNVQGLETTATYDHARREFVMHSPTLTSCKWWIGSLGRTANHAIVMAQLLIDGKSYGPHPFIVNIRDLKTHKRKPSKMEELPADFLALDGVTVGDIGPKAGYNTMDNGFLLLDHVRIPHFNMLAKYSWVDENGKYSKPPQAKLAYGTLTWVRSRIVMEARMTMARSAIVALRYTAIRRQFKDGEHPAPDGGETATLDYTMVQYRLLPVMAQAFAMHYTGAMMSRLYDSNQKSMAEGNFDLLADLHASSSGLKSLSTTMASDAIETCRRAMGGHGFSMFGGLAHLYQNYLPNVTWEGDNFMLTQQVARYLLKTARSVKAENQVSSTNPTAGYLMQFLRDPDYQCRLEDIYDISSVIRMYGHRAAYMVLQLQKQRDVEKASWNSLLVDFYKLSVAHCQFVMVQAFAQGIAAAKPKVEPATYQLLERMFYLFSFYSLEQQSAEFLYSGCVNRDTLFHVKHATMDLLAALRPDAIATTDAWDIDDYVLQSSLGRADGKVYQDMFQRAASNPLNSMDINPNYLDPELVKGEPPNPELVAALAAQTKARL